MKDFYLTSALLPQLLHLGNIKIIKFNIAVQMIFLVNGWRWGERRKNIVLMLKRPKQLESTVLLGTE